MKPNLLCVGPDGGCYIDQDHNMVLQGNPTKKLPTVLSWLSAGFSCHQISHEKIFLQDNELKIPGIPSPHRFLESCDVLFFRGYKGLSGNERTRLTLIEKLVASRHRHLALPNLVSDRDLFDQKRLFYSRITGCRKITPGITRAIPKQILVREPSDLDKCEAELGLPFLLRVDGLSSGQGLFLVKDMEEAHRVYARIDDGRNSWFIRDARPASVGKITHGVVDALRGLLWKGGRKTVAHVLATEYLDAFHQDIGAFLNGAAYFFGDNLFYAHPRLSRRHWNIHNYTAEDLTLSLKRYELAVDRFFTVLNENIDELRAIRSCLGAVSPRLDLIITNGGRLVVCEPALKNGVAKGAWKHVVPALERVGFSTRRVQETIGATVLTPSDIRFNAAQPEKT